MTSQKINGNNNVQIWGDSNIFIAGGITEQLLSAVHRLDMSQISEMMGLVSRTVESSNENIKIGLNMAEGIITLSPRNEHDMTIYTVFTVELPEQFSDCKSPEEVLQHCYFKQAKLEARVVQSETKIGETILEEYKAPPTDGAILMTFSFYTREPIQIHNLSEERQVTDKFVCIPPIPFPPASNVVFESGGCNFITTLRLQEVATNNENFTLTLTNREHNTATCDVTVTVTIPCKRDNCTDVDKGFKCSLNIKMREGSSAFQSLRYFEFIYNHAATGEMVLRGHPSGQELLGHNSPPVDPEQCGFWRNKIEFARLLLEVEQAFGVRFDELPEFEDLQNREDINLLVQIARHGKVNGTIGNLNATVSDRIGLQNLIDEVNKTGHGMIQLRHQDCYMIINNSTFSLMDRITLLPRMRVKNLDRLKRRFNDYVDGETVRVEFVPVDSHVTLDIYPKFYGTDNINEIISREQWTV